jgi:hypothetical protein
MDKIARAVLIKLFARRVIGKHHIRWATLMKCGWKAHEKGNVKEAINLLLKQGLLIWAKKSKKALVLNKKRIEEIKSLT